MKEHVYKVLLIIFSLVGLIGLIYPIDIAVYWDQCVYLLHSKFFSGASIGYNEFKFRPILLSLITAPIWIKSEDIIIFKIISILFSIVYIYTIYKNIRFHLVRNLAIWICFLALFNGILVFETRHFLTDIPSALFFNISIFYLFQRNKKSAVLCGIFFGVTILTRLGMLYFLPLLLMYYIIKKRYRDLLIFILASYIVYLPYQIWIYFMFDGLLINIAQAKIEGLNNAKYSLLKLNQIFFSFGLFTPLIAIVGFLRTNKIFLLISLLFSFFIVPYNPENFRFLIPSLLFVVLGVGYYFSESLKLGVKRISIFLVCTELLILNHYWRSQIPNHQLDHLTQTQKISSIINSSFTEYSTIITSFSYPDFALFTGRDVKVPLKYISKESDFDFIDYSLSTNPSLILANGSSIPSSQWLSLNKNFKKVGQGHGVDFYTAVKKDHKKGYKQYKAFYVNNGIEKVSKGTGFIELDDQNKVKRFYFNYNLTSDFISHVGEKCISNQTLLLNEKNNYDLIKLSREVIKIKIYPFNIGTCENTKNIVFEISFENIIGLTKK